MKKVGEQSVGKKAVGEKVSTQTTFIKNLFFFFALQALLEKLNIFKPFLGNRNLKICVFSKFLSPFLLKCQNKAKILFWCSWFQYFKVSLCSQLCSYKNDLCYWKCSDSRNYVIHSISGALGKIVLFHQCLTPSKFNVWWKKDNSRRKRPPGWLNFPI